MNCQEDGKVLMRDLQYVDLDDTTASVYRLSAGDLLFNRTNSYELVGRTAIVESDTNAVFASYLVRLTVDHGQVDPRYLNYFLNWDVAQSELKKLASRGVSQANISAGKLRNFSVPVPTPDEQREIVAILDVIDSKIDLYKRKRAVLEELFKTVLHQMMTGEIRVADLDLSVIEGGARMPASTAAGA
jgi:type I restriction enzyme S subunit